MNLRTSSSLLGLFLVAVLVACTPNEVPAGDPAEARLVSEGAQYVALGDSYTAAPGIGKADGVDGCFRSENNYPHLVADRLDLALTDVSCGGATTASITGRQRTITGNDVPPQLDALGTATDLVTVRIGGNDFGLFQLISRICPTLADRDPDGHPCLDEAERAEQGLGDLLRLLEDRVVATVRKVVDSAPNAIVLVVGYPAVVPDQGTCAALPLADGDYPFARQVNRGLNTALKAAARAVDAPYLDVYAVTRGHDICSADPWIAGESVPNGSKGAAWHPYVSEQEATARAIQEALQAD